MESHHAYFLEGSLANLQALAADARERFGFADGHPSTPLEAGNLDVYVREWEKFGIVESRRLVELSMLKSASGRSLFVLGLASITSEAQQALLKLLEEPKAGAIFILLVPHGALLATLRSRMLPYPRVLTAGTQKNTDAVTFLASPYKERSEWIGLFLKEEEGVRERVRNFMNGLEVEMYKKGTKNVAVREGLGDIAHFRGYLSDKAPSLKMILEHLAATLPHST